MCQPDENFLRSGSAQHTVLYDVARGHGFRSEIGPKNTGLVSDTNTLLVRHVIPAKPSQISGFASLSAAVMRKTVFMHFPGITMRILVLSWPCGTPSLVTHFKFTTCICGAGCQPVAVLKDRRNRRYDHLLECDILGDISVTFILHVSFRLAPPDPVAFHILFNTVSGEM